MLSIITHRLSAKNTVMKLIVVSLIRALEKPVLQQEITILGCLSERIKCSTKTTTKC